MGDILPAPGYCSCGAHLMTTGENLYIQLQHFNGEIIYAVCAHGVVVIDKRYKLVPQTVIR